MRTENTVLPGLGLVNIKYNIEIDIEVIKKDIARLTNQLWKLIPMRENEEDWNKQLNTVIVEIAGLGELLSSDPLFLQLLSKLEGLGLIDTTFEFYRKTVFECISLLQGAKNGLT